MPACSKCNCEMTLLFTSYYCKACEDKNTTVESEPEAPPPQFWGHLTPPNAPSIPPVLSPTTPTSLSTTPSVPPWVTMTYIHPVDVGWMAFPGFKTFEWLDTNSSAFKNGSMQIKLDADTHIIDVNTQTCDCFVQTIKGPIPLVLTSKGLSFVIANARKIAYDWARIVFRAR